METKICTHCHKELTLDNFKKRKDSRATHRSWCKDCTRESDQKYREKNKDKILERSRKYREENRETIRETRRKFHEKHKERVNEWHKQYYRQTIEMQRVKQKHYREQYPDRIKASQKKFKEKDINKFHEKYAVYAQIRTARKRQLPYTYTNEQWLETKKFFGGNCCYCGKKKKLTQDHFVPLSKGGGYTKENIVPACGICNSRKLDSLFEEWYPKQDDIYSREREEKIIKYLNLTKTLS